jgi:hypothetical protein
MYHQEEQVLKKQRKVSFLSPGAELEMTKS